MTAACFSTVSNPSSCDAAALNAIDAARRNEGLRAMTLPSNYGALSGPQQLLVVTNLERVDRGIPPVSGLMPTLDSIAQQAAAGCCDPQGPPGYSWQSNWAGGILTALAADYEWMYYDGPNSANAGCPPSCWTHRDNILGPGGGMGAGVNGNAFTELFVQGYPEAPVFSWSQEAQSVPVAVSASSLMSSAAPRTTGFADELVFDSGGPARLTASLAGGPPWSLEGTTCIASATWGCDFKVLFEPAVAGTYAATLIISSPQGTRQIPMRGVSGDGYWQVARDGGVFALGGGGFLGSTGGVRLVAPIVGLASTPDHGGYWLVARDGGVFAFGNASFHGSTGGVAISAPVVAIAATRTGRGYYLAGSDGAVYTFGDAPYLGGTNSGRLRSPIVGMGVTADGGGYWLVGADGGVFNFGDAGFYGSTGNIPISSKIVGMEPSPSGHGYFLAGADGAVYAFGDARFHGSAYGAGLRAPIVSLIGDRATGGYWLIASDGGVFSFGAPFRGSVAGAPLVQPVVGGAAS
jgi:hypothetical protein